MSNPDIDDQIRTDILCFSHLRWDFVYQRPQHLLTRAAATAVVHYWEEPVWADVSEPRLLMRLEHCGVRVLSPQLPHGTPRASALSMQRALLDKYLASNEVENLITWFYTPMAMLFAAHLSPLVTVYDCMDELSAFQGAPPELVEQEQRLFERADVVFAGGASLYASKRTQHEDVHLFPSSIDRNHFASARRQQEEPKDLAEIPHPRIGFYGVLDERLDLDLLRNLSAARPDWHFVLIGPVVKIPETSLPKAHNIYYLGQKAYASLPQYLSALDVAFQPFAMNASTKFISPTKTPEFLAAGKPVVSTAIKDVVRPYGELGLVEIAETAPSFVNAIARCLSSDAVARHALVDKFLSGQSWDRTYGEMWSKIQSHIQRHTSSGADAAQTSVASV